MYLMARPPYLRWTMAALLIAVGFLVEFRDSGTAAHPFAAVPLARGVPISADAIEWRQVPVGLLETPELDDAVPAVDIPAGVPIVGALLSRGQTVPDDWWALSIELPDGARPGADVLVVMTATGETVPGVVIRAGIDSGFGLTEPGVVAVPADRAAQIATAAALDDVAVAIRP